MNADILNDLAARVEALEGADREVDEMIDRQFREWPNVGDYLASEHAIWKRGVGGFGGMLAERANGLARASICAPNYTGSMDAAMTLVGPRKIHCIGESEYVSDLSRPWMAMLIERGGDLGSGHTVYSATPALALTAAALRAHAAIAKENEGG